MGTLHTVRALRDIVLLYLWASQVTFSEATTTKADSKDRKYSPRLSDVNLIKCDVCRYLAQAALEGGERLLSLVSESCSSR
jgi:hypothetical protein